MLARRGDGVERVERTSGYRFEEQDLARTGQGETRHREQLADPGHDGDPHRVTARRAVDVGNRQSPLRAVVRRASGVALEDACECASSTRDDDEVMVLRQLLEALRVRLADTDGAAARLEVAEPARKLDPLIDGLRRGSQRRGERKGLGPVGVRERDVQRMDLGCGGVPVVELQTALRAQGGVEHALRRTHRPTLQRVGVAFRREGHRVSRARQPEGQLESRLTAAYDRDPPASLAGGVPRGLHRRLRSREDR